MWLLAGIHACRGVVIRGIKCFNKVACCSVRYIIDRIDRCYLLVVVYTLHLVYLGHWSIENPLTWRTTYILISDSITEPKFYFFGSIKKIGSTKKKSGQKLTWQTCWRGSAVSPATASLLTWQYHVAMPRQWWHHHWWRGITTWHCHVSSDDMAGATTGDVAMPTWQWWRGSFEFFLKKN